MVPQDITRLLVQILPMLDPPERARDAHFRWTLSATSNCLEKERLSGQMLAGSPKQEQEPAKMQLD